jgi:uncharacterized membrane protein
MAAISGSAATEIEAPIEQVYAIAADGEGAPRWQPEIQVAECLERDAGGGQLLVRMETETPAKTLSSTLRYTYEPHSRISWAQEEGDMKAVVGSWEFEDLGGRTRATYSLEVEPGGMLAIALRGPLVDKLRGKLVDGMPGKLKAFAEGAPA